MYKLSSNLIGHESDIKGLSFSGSGELVSVSRDSTCRTWTRNDATNTWLPKLEFTGSGYLNAVATDDVTTYVGCLDGTIAVKALSGYTKWQGHEKNVCALDARNGLVVSGSWDCTARVWTTNGEVKHVLKDHQAAVWGVLVLDEDTVVTGSADKHIRVWKNGQLTKKFVAHQDVVRSLCNVGKGMFVSCSNDGTLKQWTVEGDLVDELVGHTSYVYSATLTPTGELVSSGEDRSVRVWKDGECVQAITMPCTSVWTVAVDPKNGDIACGGSDYFIRVFTRDDVRVASQDEIANFQEAVASSGIGKDQVGDVNKEKLPGVEALQKPGEKEGQVIMVKNEQGTPEAHQWTSGVWIKIGEVVGNAAGGQQKQEHEGKMYDYVFHVDIEDGKPQLPLPYNVTENPYEAARRFLDHNELPLTYMDEVARFIITNTESVDMTSGPAQDPYGSRYTPAGNTNSTPSAPITTNTTVIPHKSYLSLTSYQPEPIINAIRRNDDKQPEDKKLGNIESELLASGLRNLNAESASGLLKNAVFMTQNWSAEDMLPALDVLRIAIPSHPNPPAAAVIQMIFSTLDADLPKHSLLSTRCLVNLFGTPEGRKLAGSKQVGEHAIGVLRQLLEKNPATTPLCIAVATLLLNYAVLIDAQSDLALELLDSMSFFKDKMQDTESQYRLALAVGTVLANNNTVDTKQAVSGFGLLEWVSSLSTAEQRMADLVNEIKSVANE